MIAVGGMGRVYAGTQLPLQRRVAIKLLTGQKGGDEFRRRFLLEASVSGRLAHRNIVTVHDYGATGGGSGGSGAPSVSVLAAPGLAGVAIEGGF